MNPLEVLKQYWGYDAFREKQDEIIQSVLDGHDTLALLPTGGGKSICFQVPALCMEGICLVISPLIALMKDQVFQLQKRGISAKAIYSGMSRKEIDITLDNCKFGGIRFLYVSPERLKTRIFQERVTQMNVSLVAIDEAHCISQWGYDFRPSYLEIAEFLKIIPDARRIALTATATKDVRADILNRLEMKDGQVFQKSFARKNLSYSAFMLESKEQKLLEILSRVGGTSIVYVRTRRRTQEVAAFLRSQQISADYYHAGLSGEERNKRQDAWIQNRIRVIVSTNAFGMGIDKPDVRTVVHMDVPDSLEAYYQEAGRAGRDGRIAYAVTLFHRRDITDLMERAEGREVSLDFIKQVYQSLANFYKIAVGSHNLESLPFDLSRFCESYNLVPTEVLQGLRNLEEAGIIQLSDGVYQRARLHILISKGDLYKFEVANAKFDPLIKAILRLYGGELFSDYLFIKESDLAKMMKLSTVEVGSQLSYLNEQGIVDYQPSSDVPTLTFLTPRMVAANLPIDTNLLKFRKENAIRKAKAMVGYLETKTKCRTRVFQEYFGEETLDNCGVCDFCLYEKKNRMDIPMTKVFVAVKGGCDTLSGLYETLRDYKHDNILLAVRMLIEEGKVRMEEERIVLT